jgi:hypothetical protein
MHKVASCRITTRVRGAALFAASHSTRWLGKNSSSKLAISSGNPSRMTPTPFRLLYA